MKNSHASKSRILIAVAFVAVSLFTVFTMISVADSKQANDLLVTQSYVDSEIAKARTDIKADAFDAVKEAVNASLEESYGSDMRQAIVDMVKNDSQLRSELLKTVGSLNVSYSTVLLKKGQRLTGDCEFIPRSGKVSTYCAGINGISDMTDGKDIANSNIIPLNHYCAIPRDDGRAVIAEADSYLLVRGNYRIES